MDLATKIQKLRGPILILGAGGFVGANLYRELCRHRTDVIGTVRAGNQWRLEGVEPRGVIETDLLTANNINLLLRQTAPQTIFNTVAYGAYSFETDSQLIYASNFSLVADLLGLLSQRSIAAFVHAGSSSEYGLNAAGPKEGDRAEPNSDYAVSKRAAAELIRYYGRMRGVPCMNLRLYSVYGPLEDSSRLIPTIVRAGTEGRFPSLVNAEVSRDFVFVEDVIEAFVDGALSLSPQIYGQSFNVGTGVKTTIKEVAEAARELFSLQPVPEFGSMPDREWDVKDWFADNNSAKALLHWSPRTSFKTGLRRTAEWYRALPTPDLYLKNTKAHLVDYRSSISAIVTCYRDEQAIPIMYRRLKDTFLKLKIDHEIVFVNDCSPDDSEAVIQRLSSEDRTVVGITHSRNFGSQAAFRSGMEIASKNACVLLDGDLQDPPELIASFVERWRDGFEVVYGRRVSREATWLVKLGSKCFYRLFSFFSYVPMPKDAGDFSLIDRKVVEQILRFPERDLFLRGVRAFVGFRQTAVDYRRPERMFGVSTNSLLKNIGWAKKGILSFSYMPLNALSFLAVILISATVALGAVQVTAKLFFPNIAPRGITTVLLTIGFFGSLNLFAVSLVGEYIAKILEESKRRPHFIRRSLIRDGRVLQATGTTNQDAS